MAFNITGNDIESQQGSANTGWMYGITVESNSNFTVGGGTIGTNDFQLNQITPMSALIQTTNISNMHILPQFTNTYAVMTNGIVVSGGQHNSVESFEIYGNGVTNQIVDTSSDIANPLVNGQFTNNALSSVPRTFLYNAWFANGLTLPLLGTGVTGSLSITANSYNGSSNQTSGIAVNSNGTWAFQPPTGSVAGSFYSTGANSIYAQAGILVANPSSPGTVSHPNIIDNNGFSTASTPDYSYWNSSGDGIYHPGYGYIGIAVGGSLGLLVSNNLTGFIVDTVPNLIDSALPSGTAPVCPNGTSGALTTTGCAPNNNIYLNGVFAPTAKTIIGTALIGAGSTVVITFPNSFSFTSGTTYFCWVTDTYGPNAARSFSQTATGASFQGMANDLVAYSCTGT